MKRFLPGVLALAGLAASVSPVLGQATSASPVWGVYAGYNSATAGGSGSSGYSSMSGFVVAGTADWVLDGPWSLQGEVQYTQKGASYSGHTITLSYAEVPVLVRYALPDWGEGNTPFFLLGPDLAFKASCSVSGGGTCGSQVSSTDFGATGGFGMDFKSGSHSWNLAVRYDYGFTEVNSGSSIYNRVFTAAVGWKW
jgi:hypothetical protein